MATVTSTPTTSNLTVSGNTQVSGTISWTTPAVPSGAIIISCVLTGVATTNMSKGTATVTVNGTTVGTTGAQFSIDLGTTNSVTSVSTTAKGGNKNAAGTVKFTGLVYTVTYEMPLVLESISLNNTTITVEKNKTKTITAILNPSECLLSDLQWSTNNNNCKIYPNPTGYDESTDQQNNYGLNCEILGYEVGTSIITVTTSDGTKSASCTVTVVESINNNIEIIWDHGHVLSETGEIVSQAGTGDAYIYTYMIHVDPINEYKLTITNQKGFSLAAYSYDSNCNYIGRLTQSNGTYFVEDAVNEVLNLPDNASYIRFRCSTTSDKSHKPLVESQDKITINVNIKYTVTFKDTDDIIIDTQTIINGENASLSNVHKTGKLITNLSEDYRNITSDKTIIVTYTDIQGTDINNRMLFANALYNDIDDYDLIEVDKYSLSFYPKRVYGNIGFDFLPEWGGKDITISVSEMSSNAQIIIYDYSIDDVYAALNYPNKSITINVPNDKVNSIWVCLQARDTNICWATDICILVDNEPYTVTFKDTNGTVLKTAQTGYVNLLNHYGQKVYSSFTKLNNSISNNNDWYSWYIIDFSDYIGSRLKISSTVTFNADESINGYDAGVYSLDSTDRTTATNLGYYWTTPGTYVLDLEYFPTEESHFLSFEGGNITYSNLSITSDKNNCVDPPTSPIRENKLFIGWNGDYTNVTGNLELTAQYIDEQGINSNNALLPFTEWTGQWNAIDIERKANSVSLNTTTAWGGIYTDYPSEFLNKDIMFNISAMSSNASLVIQDATDYSALLELTNENRSGTINLTSNSNIRIVFQDDSNTGTIWLTDLWACDVNYLPTVLIAKYKFDNTLYNLIPEFNSEFTDYTYEDIVNGEVTTRTIYSDSLPTYIQFGDFDHSPAERVNSLLEVNYLDTSNITDMSSMFDGCENVEYINTSNWDVSNVTDMSGMFCSCNFTSLNVSNWNTINVTNMHGMFYQCHSLATLDVSNWDVSNVTDMSYMFQDCESLTSLDLSNWDVSNVNDIDDIFAYCYKLESLDLSKWDVGNVVDMYEVFYHCHSLKSVGDLSNWNVSNSITTNSLFDNCWELTSVGDLSNWDTKNMIDIGWTFRNCYKLESSAFDSVLNWDVSSVNEMQSMFEGCDNLIQLDLSNWDISNVTNMQFMFLDCQNLTELNISNWHLNSEINTTDIFENTNVLSIVAMNNSDYNSVNKIITELPTRTSDSIGTLNIIGIDDISQVDIITAESKFWNIIRNVTKGTTVLSKAYIGDKKISRIYIGDKRIF